MIRLLHCGHWAIKEHSESQETPEYAILSHTWELPYPNSDGKEVNYGDIKTRLSLEDPTERPSATAELKKSRWMKVENARKEAWDLGFAWIWIDSCCIDTEDPQEHTEAINSMYQWYQNSQVCIAHLSDLQGKVLGRCRWFYRGWTLQELIAPPTVFFYNLRWDYCGSRNGRPRSLHLSTGSGEGYAYEKEEDLSERIAKITSIDVSILRNNDPGRIKRALSTVPACQKMHWAWQRKTSRSEDMAYCLIGIFDINHFYLKRGERDGAFIRLQEEIIKQSSDSTLFAWRATNTDQCLADNRLRAEDLRLEGPLFAYTEDLHGVFACRPSEFQYAKNIKASQHIMYNDEISVTSKGVKLTAALWGEGPAKPFTLSLNAYDDNSGSHLGIQLRWIGGNVYARTGLNKLEDLDVGRALPSQDDIFLSRKVHYLRDCAAALHEKAINLPKQIIDGEVSLTRVSVTPGALWSASLELFMTSGTKLPVGCASYFQDDEPSRIFTLLFGLTYVNEPWSCLIEPGSELAPSPLEMRRAYIDRVWRKAFQMEDYQARLASNGVIYAASSTLMEGSYHLGSHRPFVLGLCVTKNSRFGRMINSKRQQRSNEADQSLGEAYQSMYPRSDGANMTDELVAFDARSYSSSFVVEVADTNSLGIGIVPGPYSGDSPFGKANISSTEYVQTDKTDQKGKKRDSISQTGGSMNEGNVALPMHQMGISPAMPLIRLEQNQVHDLIMELRAELESENVYPQPQKRARRSSLVRRPSVSRREVHILEAAEETKETDETG